MDFSTCSSGRLLTPWECLPSRPRGHIRIQKNLHLRLREDDGADVPSFHEHVFSLDDLAEPLVDDVPDLGDARVRGHPLSTESEWRSSSTRRPLRVRQEPLISSRHWRATARTPVRSSGWAPGLQNGQRDCPIKAARVHVEQPSGVGAPSCNGALPHPRRPVNRYYHDRKTT